MKLFDRENQVPIFTPYYISIFKSKAIKFSWVKILIVLRMWMTTNKITYIYGLYCIVTEC